MKVFESNGSRVLETKAKAAVTEYILLQIVPKYANIKVRYADARKVAKRLEMLVKTFSERGVREI